MQLTKAPLHMVFQEQIFKAQALIQHLTLFPHSRK